MNWEKKALKICTAFLKESEEDTKGTGIRSESVVGLNHCAQPGVWIWQPVLFLCNPRPLQDTWYFFFFLPGEVGAMKPRIRPFALPSCSWSRGEVTLNLCTRVGKNCVNKRGRQALLRSVRGTSCSSPDLGSQWICLWIRPSSSRLGKIPGLSPVPQWARASLEALFVWIPEATCQLKPLEVTVSSLPHTSNFHSPNYCMRFNPGHSCSGQHVQWDFFVFPKTTETWLRTRQNTLKTSINLQSICMMNWASNSMAPASVFSSDKVFHDLVLKWPPWVYVYWIPLSKSPCTTLLLRRRRISPRGSGMASICCKTKHFSASYYLWKLDI